MKIESSDSISHSDDFTEYRSKPLARAKIELLDVVALTHDIPKHNLRRGEVGTVVEIPG